MTYVKNGGYIRMVSETQLPRFIQMGFAPMPQQGQKVNKPARAPKKEQPHGGA